MSVAPGTHFGPYEILGPLGAGGMGEVYRARDSRLDRLVAFKIIRPDLADQPARRQRLRREARAISSLNHPNICALYDVGEQDDITFLVMEYLNGETVAARLLRGPFPLDELLGRAREVAAALDHAHRQGVVHRDLKPSNVMLTATGAKLLDFGIAKLLHTDPAIVSETATATIEGSIVGTVQYMAPEQLEGKEVDGRSDIFAFGALVHEMATGQKAFTGSSQASLIAAILRAEPPRVSVVDPLVPPALDRVVARCLAKDPDERWQTARDLFIELRAIDASPPGDEVPVKAQGDARRRPLREALAWTVAVVATLVAASIGIRYWQLGGPASGTPADPPAATVRFEIPAPEGTSVGSIALSPDSRHLVFVGRRGIVSRLWLRPLDSLSAEPLANTEGADYPFWKPDGRSVGFFADGKLKRIDVPGGPVHTLADAPNNRGGAWGSTGTIVFSPSSQGLYRVSDTGGPLQPVTELDASRGDISHRWPAFLPDGERFLYLAQSSVPENRGLFVGSLDGSTNKFVVRTESSGAYVAPGYLLFLRDTRLMAQRFRAADLADEGSPVPLAEPVGVNGLERAQFEIAAGSLIYRRGSFLGSSELAWLDRSGQRVGTIGAPADFRAVRISPDGGNVALAIEDQRVGTPDVWVHHVVRDHREKFTFDPGTDRDPVWLPGGTELAVRSNRNEQAVIYVRALDKVGGERVLLESRQNASIHDWSRDGRWVLFTQVDPAGTTDRDIWVLPTQGDRTPYPFVQARLDQDFPRFSPNGRLVSYQTGDSGRNTVYVAPFPATGDKWEISPQGGVQPIWRADGQELFYVAPDNTIMAVDVHEGPATIQFGKPRRLFQAPMAVMASRQPSWTWDVSADGKKFLIILAKDDPAPLTLVTNWLAALEGRKD